MTGRSNVEQLSKKYRRTIEQQDSLYATTMLSTGYHDPSITEGAMVQQ